MGSFLNTCNSLNDHMLQKVHSKKYKTWFDKDHVNYFGRVSKSLAKARAKSLIKFSKDTSSPECLYYVGVIYERGYGVKKKINLAFKSYLKSARSKWVPSMERVALFYKNGIGTEINESLGIKWYKKAAELGSIISMRRISSFYEKGLPHGGIEKNMKKSVYWKNLLESNQELDSRLRFDPSKQIEDENEKRLKKGGSKRSNSFGEITNQLLSPKKFGKKFSWQKVKERIIREKEFRERRKSNDGILFKPIRPAMLLHSNSMVCLLPDNNARNSTSNPVIEKIKKNEKRSKSLVNRRLMILSNYENQKKIYELKQRIRILADEKERIRRSFQEERQTHIRTQQTLRNLQREFYSFKKSNEDEKK